MARYRIVEDQPGIYHLQEKVLFLWSWRATAYSMNEADEKLNNLRQGYHPIPGFPRVVRTVND